MCNLFTFLKSLLCLQGYLSFKFYFILYTLQHSFKLIPTHQFTNLHVPHFCTTLWYIFKVQHFYLVNVPHFWLMYHTFYSMYHTFICSMFYTLSTTLFTFLKTLLCQHGYLSLLNIWWSWKGPWFKLYTLLYIQSLFHKCRYKSR